MDRTVRTAKCNIEQLLRIISMSQKADSTSQSTSMKLTYSPRPRKMNTSQPSSEFQTIGAMVASQNVVILQLVKVE